MGNVRFNSLTASAAIAKTVGAAVTGGSAPPGNGQLRNTPWPGPAAPLTATIQARCREQAAIPTHVICRGRKKLPSSTRQKAGSRKPVPLSVPHPAKNLFPEETLRPARKPVPLLIRTGPGTSPDGKPFLRPKACPQAVPGPPRYCGASKGGMIRAGQGWDAGCCGIEGRRRTPPGWRRMGACRRGGKKNRLQLAKGVLLLEARAGEPWEEAPAGALASSDVRRSWAWIGLPINDCLATEAFHTLGQT